MYLQRNLTEYFVAVDINNMLQLYASMLHERRIIITSRKLSTVSVFLASHPEAFGYWASPFRHSLIKAWKTTRIRHQPKGFFPSNINVAIMFILRMFKFMPGVQEAQVALVATVSSSALLGLVSLIFISTINDRLSIKVQIRAICWPIKQRSIIVIEPASGTFGFSVLLYNEISVSIKLVSRRKHGGL